MQIVSKITNVASALPLIPAKKIKELENEIFKFIWNHKISKMSREDAKLPESRGGLNFPCIKSSWRSFKMSFLRKIVDIQNKLTPWYLILQHHVNIIGYNLENIVYWSLEDLKIVTKNIKLSFWKECFSIFTDFLTKLDTCNLDRFLDSPPWGHPRFKYRNQHISVNCLGALPNNYVPLRAFITLGINGNLRPISQEQFTANYPNATPTAFRNIHEATARVIRGSEQMIACQLDRTAPSYTTIAWVAHWSLEGCGPWAKFIKSTNGGRSTLADREQKWVGVLNLQLGQHFWNSTYKSTANIRFDNNLKIFQTQVNRGVLKTNDSVNHFKQEVGMYCNSCGIRENNFHCLWECTRVRTFLNSLPDAFNNSWLQNKGAILKIDYIFNHRGTCNPRGLFLMLVM